MQMVKLPCQSLLGVQMNRLLIIGAGGHGRVVADCAEKQGYKDIAFIDDCYPERTSSGKWQVIGKVNDWQKLIAQSDLIVAFGNNELRQKTIQYLQENQVVIKSIVHPTAVIGSDIELGESCVIFANAVVNIGSKIADGCIINTGATIDHDCQLEQLVHISPGAHIAGGVKIGAYSWIGIGSAVVEYIELAQNTKTGAGAAIIAPTEENSLYVGVPAKKIKTLKPITL